MSNQIRVHERPRLAKRFQLGGVALACAGCDGCGAVHGHSRCVGRERRPAVDPARPALLAEGLAVGDHCLLDPVRRHAAFGRPPCRPARTQATVHGRRRGVHARLAALGVGVVGGLVDRLSRAAGAGGRTARTGGTVDRRHDLPGRARAQLRPRRVGRDLRCGRRRRRVARRRPHLVPELVVDLLRQPPCWRGHRRGQPVAPAREPGCGGAPAFRCLRCDLDHGRPDGAGLRDHAGEPAGLGQRRHGRPLRRRPR